MANRNREELADFRIEMILRALEGLEYGTLFSSRRRHTR